MSEQPPITPPLELVDQWICALEYQPDAEVFSQAARWGADQELEACCEYVREQWFEHPEERIAELRAARRPKPPSDKQEALSALEQIDGWAVWNMRSFAIHDDLVKGVDTIRRALEALPDD